MLQVKKAPAPFGRGRGRGRERGLSVPPFRQGLSESGYTAAEETFPVVVSSPVTSTSRGSSGLVRM